MPAKIIGLHGLARSGKDTVAAILAEQTKHTEMLSFATPLKLMLTSLLGSATYLHESEKEKTIEWLGRSPRYLLQTLGTEWGRDLVHPDIWIRLLERRVEFCRDASLIVITDVRFENEAAWVRKHGQLVHVMRDKRPPIGGTDNHASEYGLPIEDADYIIANNGTLDKLREIVYTVQARSTP